MRIRKRPLLAILLAILVAVSLLPAHAEVRALGPVEAAATPAPGGVRLLSSGAGGVAFEVLVPWQQLAIRPLAVEGKAYVELSLPGWTAATQPGAPELPMLHRRSACPSGRC